MREKPIVPSQVAIGWITETNAVQVKLWNNAMQFAAYNKMIARYEICTFSHQFRSNSTETVVRRIDKRLLSARSIWALDFRWLYCKRCVDKWARIARKKAEYSFGLGENGPWDWDNCSNTATDNTELNWTEPRTLWEARRWNAIQSLVHTIVRAQCAMVSANASRTSKEACPLAALLGYTAAAIAPGPAFKTVLRSLARLIFTKEHSNKLYLFNKTTDANISEF